MPAPRNILAAAVEGTQVDFDTALTLIGSDRDELASDLAHRPPW